MAGSTIGKNLSLTTWGESHGKAIGAVLDGFPAGMELSESDIQIYLDRRKPGQSAITTARKEDDKVEILSGVFEGKTTGTPISILIPNTSQHSKDYGNLATCYRPGHADYGYDCKYEIRDYRGGGRSSGRETAARVAAGAIALKLLSQMGIHIHAYTKSLGPINIEEERINPELFGKTVTGMPDLEADQKAQEYMKDCMASKDSAGGVIECAISGVPAGIGDPVFDKLDALLGKAILSIGAVKAVEIGDGIAAAKAKGSENNDAFRAKDHVIYKETNHAGGILGGISDGSDIMLRAHIKPTPSIYQEQKTVNDKGEEIDLTIAGRHDPVIVPRAVVVVEAMCGLTILDAMMSNMSAKASSLLSFYGKDN